MALSRRLRMEPLEDRRLLAIASEMGANEALQFFSTSTALFVENQGQWQDESLRYAFNGPSANIGFTNEGLKFLLTERETIEAYTEATNSSRSPEALGNYSTHSTQFSVSFDGANLVVPKGLDESQSRFNILRRMGLKWMGCYPRR